MTNHAQSLSNQVLINEVSGIKKGLKLSTDDIFARERRDWLQEMICQDVMV